MMFSIFFEVAKDMVNLFHLPYDFQVHYYVEDNYVQFLNISATHDIRNGSHDCRREYDTWM